MIITKHLIEQFISLQGISIERLLVGLNQIGLEVEKFRELRAPSGVVVGKVLKKAKHPSADKLSVCEVDVGERVAQIVCGASNVAQDQWVAVALEGCVLESEKGEMRIAKASLRGVESCGMICSSSELGFPKVGDGILVLDSSVGELKAGEELSAYVLFDNFIIEIGLTPNRGDCLSVLGVARDLSVALGIAFGMRNDVDENSNLGIGRALQIRHEGEFGASMLYKVARLASQAVVPLEVSLSLAMCEIAISHSLQDFLSYAMHNAGAILRIYPLDRFRRAGASSEARAEVLLKRENGWDCVYSTQMESVVGVSGSEIPKGEGLFLLESSYIDPIVVSELVFREPNLPRDPQIVYRTTRGSNPDVLLGMRYLCALLIKYLDIEVYSSHYKNAIEKKSVSIKMTFEAIDSILGEKIDEEEITHLLKKMGCRIEANSDETFFMVIPPFYRHDIETIQDVAEEVLRFYGIEKVQNTPLRFLDQNPRENPLFFRYRAKRNLIKRAVSQGFYETLHYLFYQRSKMQELGLEVVDPSLDISNPITSELDTFRSSLIPAMLDSIERNHNLGFKSIGFCEIGICCDRHRNESEKIAFVVDEWEHGESLSHPKGVKWDFYRFASCVGNIIGEFELEAMEDPINGLFHPFVSAWIYKNHQRIGCIGKVNPKSGYVDGWMCELELESLLIEEKRERKEICKYPSSLRDLTLMIDRSIPFSRIKQALNNARIEHLLSFYPLDLYKSEEFGEEVALSLRFVLQSQTKTLQEDDLTSCMQEILSLLEKEFNARLRQ